MSARSWYTPILRPFLGPAAAAYGSVVRLRNYCYDRSLKPTFRSRVPVICVGNVVAGGSGKSPFAGWLVEELLAQGHRPVLLSRGYGGRVKGPHLVSSADTPADVGDEAVMHREHHGLTVPIVIARDRSAGARYIRYNQLGDVIVLDDGYQHRRLERNIDILLLDVSSPSRIERWRSGSLLPAGYLREPLDDALRRAHCVVFVNRTSAARREVEDITPYRRVPPSIPTFAFLLTPSTVEDAATKKLVPLSQFKGTRAGALTAIAAPGSFLEMLKGAGIELIETATYRDHHHFSRREWDSARAACSGAPLFTTAKDAVKLRPYVTEPGTLYVLHLSGRLLSETQHKAFWRLAQTLLHSEEASYERSSS